jgi:asparagine synthase (glutamine-hydrolysing)
LSAVLGILRLDTRPVEHPVLEQMLESLAHRGPDGAYLWYDGIIGLGHQMLHTTPESFHERLPLVDRRRNHVITADARIDNRDELIAALGLRERLSEKISDGELILGAYEKWGERCPERLLGDFAFAIWDQRKQRLFCARDHMGVKPFYYYRSKRIFLFASEIKALLRVPEVPRHLNELRVAEYLVPTVEDKTITFYQDIFRLLPGHSMMVVPGGKVSTRQYWALDSSREVQRNSNEEYAAEFREIFTEAVRCRLRSAYPVGSELSGGLDSSSIVCTARELLAGDTTRRLHTFSAVYDNVPKSDEREFIDAVLDGGGLEPHFMRADQLGPLREIGRTQWHLDEPPLTGAFVNWELQKLAKQEGVRVVLTGSDGDTVVNQGDAYLLELARSWRWKTLAAEINALSHVTNRPRRRFLLQTVVKPLTPEFALQTWRVLRRHERPAQTTYTAGSLLRQDFALRVGLEEHIEASRQNPTGPLSLSRAAHWRGLVAAIWPYVLELGDGIGAAGRSEYRHPFFDRRLVEFCLALPPDQQLSRGWSRAILRHAMVGTLPEKVRWRKSKGDQSYGWARNLLTLDLGLLDELIIEDTQLIEEYVDLNVLRETYQRFLSRSLPADYHRLVAAAYLVSWLRRTELSS